MNNQKLVIGSVVVAIVLSLFAVFHGSRVGPSGPAGQNGRDGRIVGGSSSQENTEPVICNGGVCFQYFRVPMNTSSSTACAIKPFATSTLVRFNAVYTTATGTAISAILATSTTPFAPPISSATASSTVLAIGTFAANVSGTGLAWVPQAQSLAGAYSVSGTFPTVVNGTSTAMFSVIPGSAPNSVNATSTSLIYYHRGGANISDANTGGYPSGWCTGVLEQI